MPDLTAFALVCSLTPSPAPSSSDLMARHILDRFAERGIATSSARVVDHDVAPGVQKDMGNGDEWPVLREKILAADILVLSTPIWVGHPSSLAQRVMERLDADIAETDEEGRPVMAGKVAVVAVVGNEDGAHKTVADMMQGLNDIGFSLPSQGSTYWVGEAMQSVDFKDLAEVPEVVATTTAGVVRNAEHLAKLLRRENFPLE